MAANLSLLEMKHIFIPDTPNVSLVAFYGDKPSSLKSLLILLQQYLVNSAVFKSKFHPYSLEQAHCTVIGCEGLKTELGIVNKWFYEKRREIKYIKLAEFLDYLLTSNLFPLDIRFGSYKPSHDYNFLSRNFHPYKRSFHLQPSRNNTLIPILIGWSVKGNLITLELETLRKQAQKCNLLHKYHNRTESIDNDFYLRLGTIKGQFNPETIAEIETEIRNILQKIPPVRIVLEKKHLAFVQYQNLSLPIETSKIIPLSEITEQKLLELY